MAVKTALEHLEEAEAALSAARKAQEVAMQDGKQVKMANLSALRDDVIFWRKQYALENGGGLTINIGGARRD